MDPTRAIRAAAYHEAGHAVTAALLGRDVIDVEIREDGSGVANVEMPLGPLADLDRVIYIAGPMAGSWATGLPFDPAKDADLRAIGERDADDRWRHRSTSEAAKHATALRAHRFVADQAADLEYDARAARRTMTATLEAARMLWLNWLTISRVAAALIDRRKITGAELGKLMKDPA